MVVPMNSKSLARISRLTEIKLTDLPQCCCRKVLSVPP